MMKVSYDKTVDAVYIYLVDHIDAGDVTKTYPCDPVEIEGEINLDFNSSHHLIGIEILDASKKLPKEFLDNVMT